MGRSKVRFLARLHFRIGGFKNYSAFFSSFSVRTLTSVNVWKNDVFRLVCKGIVSVTDCVSRQYVPLSIAQFSVLTVREQQTNHSIP